MLPTLYTKTESPLPPSLFSFTEVIYWTHRSSSMRLSPGRVEGMTLAMGASVYRAAPLQQATEWEGLRAVKRYSNNSISARHSVTIYSSCCVI